MESVLAKRLPRPNFEPPPAAKRRNFGYPQPPLRPPIVEEPEKNFIEQIIDKYTNPRKRSRVANDDDDDDDGSSRSEHEDDDDDKDDKHVVPAAPAAFGGINSGAKRKLDDAAAIVPEPLTERTSATAVAHYRPINHKRQPNKLSAQSFMLQLLRADADEEAERLRNTRVHRTWEYEVLNMRFRGESVGDVRIKKKRAALEFIYENITAPSKHQRLMHLGLEALSYASFFGEELNANLVRILREHNWSELRTEGICEAPRRFGKSRGISMDNAAEIVTQPGSAHSEYGHDVLLYANNHRASKMDLLQGYRDIKVLSSDPEFGGKIESMNKNESLNFITKDGYTNTMYCYPAKPDNLRGTGSKYPTGTVIAEEFAYWPEDLFFSVLAPTLTRRNVKFFGITTVNGSDSFVTPLTTAKYPDGRSVFLCMNFQLICAECKAAHREHLCKCLLGDIPHWQSSTQHEKLSIIMERKIGKFLQEIKGLSIDETVSPAFCQVSCEFLRTPESIMPIKEIYSEIVYTAVDPACGGKYSKFAIVSAIFRDGLMIVSVSFILFVFVVVLWWWFLLALGVTEFQRTDEHVLAQLVHVFARIDRVADVEWREAFQHRHKFEHGRVATQRHVLRQSPPVAALKEHGLQFGRHREHAEK